MARFTAVPDIPTTVAAQWESQVLEALKQNVELLCGIRGEADRISQALLRGTVRVNTVPPLSGGQVTARGTGFTISGAAVAGLDDYALLVQDVQKLANDVTVLRAYVNALISQIRG